VLCLVPSLLSIFLFKKRILKTIRSTYLTTIVLISFIVICCGIFLGPKSNEIQCGFPPSISIPLLIFILTPPSLILQYVLNRLWKVK
jgi:hypothetical protein